MAEFEGLTEAVSTIVPIKNRRVWRDLARILSTVFNPFLTAFALFAILAHIGARDTVDFWRLLFLSTFFTSLGPMLYVSGSTRTTTSRIWTCQCAPSAR
jgi:hypothetical protein